MRYIFLLFLYFFPICLFAQADKKQAEKNKLANNPNLHYYQMMQLLQQKLNQSATIKIAVIDDGFRLSHKSIKNYVYTNTKELSGNYQDDDKNGFVDDLHGWDVSDNDNDVAVKKGQEDIFYHGTYIASIITDVIENVLGATAAQLVKIVPIKAVPDNTRNTYLKDGFKGFRYAKSIGADIICCAWTGGNITDDDKAIIKELIGKGTIIIAAAGNFSNDQILPPASIDGVICVSAVDSSSQKIKESNYSMRVDICAPGKNVFGAFPEVDNSFIYENGTSPATALVTGCVAVLKLLFPAASLLEIEDALRNTATAIDRLNLRYSGKLGAGIPDLTKAISFLANPSARFASFDSARAKGKIFIPKSKTIQHWRIAPAGSFNGLHLYANTLNDIGEITVFNSDTICFKGKVNDMIGGIYFAGNNFDVEVLARKNKEASLSYYMETIDSTKLYCSGINNIEVTEAGILTDNSVNNNYANNCSCQWQLIAPIGKRIKIEMLEIDTEPNTDFIWFFDGDATLQERLLAKFSGTEKPPIIESISNKLLVWFLSDDVNTGKGWKMKYSLVKSL